MICAYVATAISQFSELVLVVNQTFVVFRKKMKKVFLLVCFTCQQVVVGCSLSQVTMIQDIRRQSVVQNLT